jgi:hypothetical protein
MKSLSDPEVRRSVIARVQRLRPDTQRRWGRMTVHQMLCHLNDSYKVGTGEKFVTSRSGRFQRTIMKWIALRAPLEWPKGIKTLPEVEQGCGGTAPVVFERDRDELLRLIDDFCTRREQSFAPAHPLFGPMDHGDWLRWGYLHADHHLRQFGV